MGVKGDGGGLFSHPEEGKHTHSVLSIVQPRSMKPNMSNINDANGAMGQL